MRMFGVGGPCTSVFNSFTSKLASSAIENPGCLSEQGLWKYFLMGERPFFLVSDFNISIILCVVHTC